MTTTTTILMAFPALYLYSLDATRCQARRQPARRRRKNTHHSRRLQNLQHLKQQAKLGYRRMQRSVAMLFFVGAYVSHPSVLDTSVLSSTSTHSRASSLIFEQTIMSYVNFPCFVLMVLILLRLGNVSRTSMVLLLTTNLRVGECVRTQVGSRSHPQSEEKSNRPTSPNLTG